MLLTNVRSTQSRLPSLPSKQGAEPTTRPTAPRPRAPVSRSNYAGQQRHCQGDHRLGASLGDVVHGSALSPLEICFILASLCGLDRIAAPGHAGTHVD